MNMKLVRVLLTGEGYEVRTAADALEALDILKEWRPLLILMDIQLPGIDGLELTRRLKADSATGDEERILAAGCDAYIAKPIDTRTLPGIIAALIEKAADCKGP